MPERHQALSPDYAELDAAVSLSYVADTLRMFSCHTGCHTESVVDSGIGNDDDRDDAFLAHF